MTNPVLEDDVVERLREMAKHELAHSQSTHAEQAGWKIYAAMRRNSAVFYSKTADLIERLQKELGEAREALAFGTSADAYYNLEGALIDMRRTGVADIVCIRTIERVQQQIAAVAKAIRSMDGGAK